MPDTLRTRELANGRQLHTSVRRRGRIFAIAVAAVAVCGLLLAIWGFVIEPDLLRVRHVIIETKKWPERFSPLRIAAIADIHAGAPWINETKLDRIVADVNALQPDIILLLGDYVMQRIPLGRPMAPETIARHLGELRATHGVYAVLGNHEWYGDGERTWRALENVGIRVLENRAVPVPGLRGEVWLAGIADDSTRHPDPRVAFRAIPADAAVTAFTHDPAIFPDIPPRAALTVAGHTHGGQVSIPFVGPIFIPGRSPLRYAHGLIHENGNDLYVTSGIGTTGLPVRFNVPPEFADISLRAPSR